ncbi:MAG: Na+/H+ antiporter NhaA [Hyphomicrobiaceae bacterium]
MTEQARKRWIHLRGWDFIFKNEAAGGVILATMALMALLASNTALAGLYDSLLRVTFSIRLGDLALEKPLLLWINDGLMAIFFFLVGLEIKREIVEGELSTLRRAALPAIAALGGMLVPAMIYAGINAGDPAALRGWAIPAATDIAFALGLLALLGSRVPVSLKVFLLALAIIDDLGAIIIIAFFYTSSLSMTAVVVAAVAVAGLAVLNRRGVTRLAPYMLIGLVVWVAVLKSGVHATLAGVIVALFVPLYGDRDGEAVSPLKDTEHALAPWVQFGILPAFAFANAGVQLTNLSLADLTAPIPLGIALGLFLGKQIGIMSFVWMGTRLGFAELPAGVTWRHVYGVSMLGGIGFTMSLFIGGLAFPGVEHAAAVRIGVLAGSLLSGICGYLVLQSALATKPAAVASCKSD